MTLSFYQHAKSQTSKSKIGVQAHELTTLLDAGFPVPKGFLVAADTCKAFFLHGRLQDKIKMLLERADYHDPQDLVRVSHNIQKLISSHEFPHEAAQSLLEASVKLSNERVMLTASPIGTTLETNQTPTRLYGVEGEANILLSIRNLWASQFAADDLYYIYTTEDHEFPCMAICVQVQPRATASGILMTTDSQNKHTCKTEVVFGEGAYLHKLQGADTYWIDKETGNETENLRNLQTREQTWSQGELLSSLVPPIRQKKRKLPTSVLSTLGKLAHDLQQKLFYPQEITFVYDGKKIFLIETHTSTLNNVALLYQPSPQTKHVLLKGVGAAPGIITGVVRVVRGPNDNTTRPGEIVVAHSLSQIANSVLRSAQGVIIEEETKGEALIELAQKGVALLMSAAGATDLLEPGSFVTLHTPRGEVLAGGYTGEIRLPPLPKSQLHTATRIGTTLALGSPLVNPNITLHGHVVLSPHRLIREVGVHPLQLVKDHKTRTLADPLAHALGEVCLHFHQEPLLYAFSHLASDEYAMLSGAGNYETLEERNPLMGYYGAARILQTPEILQPEFEALTSVRKAVYGKRLSLLIPPARSAYEVRLFEELLTARGLSRSASCRHYADLSIPSLLWQLEAVSHLIDGVVLNLDNLYSHLFAHDPSSDTLRFHATDVEPSLLVILAQARQLCLNQGLSLILRGSLLESDTFLSLAVEKNIGELIIAGKMLNVTQERLVTLEEEYINHV